MTNTNMLHSDLTAFHTARVGNHDGSRDGNRDGNRAARRRGAGSNTGMGTGARTGLAHGRLEGSRPDEAAVVVGGRLRADGDASPSGRRVGWVDLGLPDAPWTVRVLYGGGRRAAMEIHEHGELRDVVVESTLGTGLLRGARRVRRRGRAAVPDGDNRPTSATIAWGRLPESGTPPLVTFLNRGRNGRSCGGWVVPVAERFWIACVEGAFSRVRVETTDGARAKARAGRTRATAGPATDDAGSTS